jgi:hypothetical protein
MVFKIVDREEILERKRRQEERDRQLAEQGERWRHAKSPLDAVTPDDFVDKANTARQMLTTSGDAESIALNITTLFDDEGDDLMKSQKTPDLETVMKLLQ